MFSLSINAKKLKNIIPIGVLIVLISIVGYHRWTGETFGKTKAIARFNNQTQSLAIIKSDFVERGQKIKQSYNSEITRLVKVKDYSITFRNDSNAPIAGIIFSFKRNGEIKMLDTSDTKISQAQQLKPHEVRTRQINSVDSDLVPNIECIVFDDRSFEGDSLISQDLLNRWDGCQQKLTMVRSLLEEIENTPDPAFERAFSQFVLRMNTDLTPEFYHKMHPRLGPSPEERRNGHMQLGEANAIDIMKPFFTRLQSDHSKATLHTVIQHINQYISSFSSTSLK